MATRRLQAIRYKGRQAQGGAYDPRSDYLEREARLLATLNHPHVAAIYGFEDSGGLCGSVLELATLIQTHQDPPLSGPARQLPIVQVRSGRTNASRRRQQGISR